MYFTKHIVLSRCSQALKTLFVILGSIHEFGLICMFSSSFQSTLNVTFNVIYNVLSLLFVSSIVGDVNA